MVKMVFLFLFLFFSTSAFAEDCTYQFDIKNSLVQGTGYKFTDKQGVTAKFKSFNLSRNTKQKSLEDLIKGLVITVDLKSLDSGDPLRDRNILETLFAKLVGGLTAVVSVKNLTDKSIQTELKINNRSQKVKFDYSVQEDVLTARGQFDSLQYGFGKQIENLKKRCGPLHVGKDGKSVTWTDFGLSVKAKILKVCKKAKPKIKNSHQRKLRR